MSEVTSQATKLKWIVLVFFKTKFGFWSREFKLMIPAVCKMLSHGVECLMDFVCFFLRVGVF